MLHEKSTTTCAAEYKAGTIEEWRWILYPWALVEDVGQFIRDMDPRPATFEQVQEALQKRHGFTLDEESLLRVVRFNDLELSHS